MVGVSAPQQGTDTRQVIQFGALVEMAGLPLDDPELLMGVFDSAAENCEDLGDARLQTWQQSGNDFLDARKTRSNRSLFLEGETDGQRVHRLADLGGLLFLAGFKDGNPDMILGMLLEIASGIGKLDEQILDRYRIRGQAILEARAEEKRMLESLIDATDRAE